MNYIIVDYTYKKKKRVNLEWSNRAYIRQGKTKERAYIDRHVGRKPKVTRMSQKVRERVAKGKKKKKGRESIDDGDTSVG